MSVTTKVTPGAESYVIETDALELRRGSAFHLEPGPVESGQLAIIEIGDLQTVGRYYPDVAGCDWIVQPGLLIQVAGKTLVRVVGPVVPCPQAV